MTNENDELDNTQVTQEDDPIEGALQLAKLLGLVPDGLDDASERDDAPDERDVAEILRTDSVTIIAPDEQVASIMGERASEQGLCVRDTRIWDGPTPPGSFLSPIGKEPGVMMSTPEFMFLRQAQTLDETAATLLASELVGHYMTKSVRPDLGDDEWADDTPDTYVDDLFLYLFQVAGTPQGKRAISVAIHVVEADLTGLESPTQAWLALLADTAGVRGVPIPVRHDGLRDDLAVRIECTDVRGLLPELRVVRELGAPHAVREDGEVLVLAIDMASMADAEALADALGDFLGHATPTIGEAEAKTLRELASHLPPMTHVPSKFDEDEGQTKA